jgi:hypothetical protein
MYNLCQGKPSSFQEYPTACQAAHRPKYIQLNNGPYPKAAHWRCLLHDCIITIVVCDVYQVATRCHGAREEEELMEEWLNAWRKAR